MLFAILCSTQPNYKLNKHENVNTMNFNNTAQTYGFVIKFLHWAMAIAIFALFGLGVWMRTLTYYSPWYKPAPHWHQSIGILLLVLLVFRLAWRLSNVRPNEDYLKPFERFAARAMHITFYLILFIIMISGYFITSVDGSSVDVFNWFSIPSIYEKKGAEELAGFIHWTLAYAVMALAGLHTLAALKHHFLDHDITLKRMLPERWLKP